MFAPKVSPEVNVVASRRPRILVRYFIATLSFFGLFNLYAVRVNMSVAIVAMVKRPRSSDVRTMNSSDTASGTCPYPDGDAQSSSSANDGDLRWSNEIQGIILGSFFYGYIATQLIGGWLANKLGSKLPFGVSIVVSALLSFFIPWAARSHYGAVVAIRVLQGVVQGVTFPAMHAILGRWSPPNERSRMSVSYCGLQVGTVITLVLCGVIADSLGWEAIFYIFGAMGCLWGIPWFLFASSTPEENVLISEEEKRYIKESIGTQGVSPKIPWRKIVCSLRVWTICIGASGHNWGFYTLITSLPSYLSKVLHFSIRNNGFFSALPYIASVIVMTTVAYVADTFKKRGIMSQTKIRRSFHFVGQLCPSALLIALGYVGCDHTAAIVVLTLAVALDGIASAGYKVIHVDLSPTYAGILMGMSNTVSSVPGMISPLIVGLVTSGPNGDTVMNWRIVFYITAAVSMSCAVFFGFFASADLAEWDPAYVQVEPANAPLEAGEVEGKFVADRPILRRPKPATFLHGPDGVRSLQMFASDTL